MTITTVPTDVGRDRWGRPLVVPRGGGKAKAYTRCTTYVGCLEDTYNLARWQQRMVATGLADRPDLLLAVSAHRDDKRQLNSICEKAIEAAKGSAAATTGTAVHSLTEVVDRGETLPVIPDAARADLEAYREATAVLDVVSIEPFTVCDELQVGGTPDRIVSWQGRNFIADIKTGSIDWGIGKIAMQLAVYSRSCHYDPDTSKRTPLPDVDQSNGIIIHLPAGTGTCELVWVNLAAGWDAVQLATRVRDWRNAKNLTAPFGASKDSLRQPA